MPNQAGWSSNLGSASGFSSVQWARAVVTSGCCAHHPTQRTVKLLGPRPAHCEPQIQAITAVQTTEKQKRFRLASSGFQADGFLSSPLSCAAPSLFSGSQARLKVGQLSAGL